MADHAEHFDPADPHGFHAHDDHAGHVILPLRTLVIVLAALLFFTLLTVSAGAVEVWIADAFGVHIPTWVNVFVAMSIATIKGILVLMYFMQLKYDNPLNTIIFLFCIFAFALFMGLTALDVGNRDALYDWKRDQIIAGGNSVGLSTPAAPREFAAGRSIVTDARENAIAKYGLETFEKKAAEKHAGHHAESSSEMSRAATGLTPGLFDAEPPAAATADPGEHAGDHAGEHADDGEPTETEADPAQTETETDPAETETEADPG